MKLLAVYTTVAEPGDAEMLATAAVERRLAACVQVNRIESFYPWKGTLQKEAEFRLLFKTTAEKYAALERLINELHPYELPAIYALDVAESSPEYESWVIQSTESALIAGTDA